MIWIIDEENKESYQIAGTNIHEENDLFELWATKISGKTIKLVDSKLAIEVLDYKAAIDYAIHKGLPVFKL